MILNNSKPCIPNVDPNKYVPLVYKGNVDNMQIVAVTPTPNNIPFTAYTLENMQRAGVPLRPLNISALTGSDNFDILNNFVNSFESSIPTNSKN